MMVEMVDDFDPMQSLLNIRPPDGSHGEERLVGVQRSAVHRVEKHRSPAVHERPQGLSPGNK